MKDKRKMNTADRQRLRKLEARVAEQTVFTRDDAERMVRVEEGLAHLTDTVTNFIEVAQTEDGFPWAAARREQVKALDDKVQKLESTSTWLYRSVVGATILAAIGMLWSHSSSITGFLSKAFAMNP